MSNNPRRGATILAVCALTGLAMVGTTPATAAADDSGLLVLTDSQADALAKRVQLDPYGDAAAVADPQHAQERPDAATVPTPDTDSGGGAESLGDAGTASTSWKVTARSAMEGVSGMAKTTPIAGTQGDYLVISALGVVQRRNAGDKQVWQRDNSSLYADWKVSPTRPWQGEPYPSRIVMGFNAVGPFTPASDNGYATEDLTGDGVDDLAITASVGVSPYRPFTSPGSSLPNGTFVTVLDGATGKTLWTKLYAGAYNIAFAGKTLVVADSPYFNLNSPAGSKTTLNGIRFTYDHGTLVPSSTWTYDAGAYTAVGWGALEPLGDGRIAASWNQRKVSADAAPSGHTLVFDASDGTVVWSQTNRLYSREIHVDASRGRLVALEQSDPNEGVRYEIASYTLADGGRSTLDSRVNALPLAFALGDLQGDTRPEYAVSESTLDSGLFINANSVRALDGDTGTALWSRTVKRDAGNGHDGGAAWGLEIVDGKLAASYRDDAGIDGAVNRGGARFARLALLSGNNGSVRWEQRGIVASQVWAQPFLKDRGWRLRTVDTSQNIRTYGVGSGKQESLVPLRAQVSSAVAVDVNGDAAQDVVVGGESNGLFAYDGPSLVAGTPRLLWSATVPGQVHATVKADTNGDGRDEIVVAADSAAVVLDSRTGKVLTTIDGQGQFVRSVVAADLDRDRKAEVVVATDKVRVYSGAAEIWEYAPTAAGDVIFSDVSVGDGRVYAQFASRNGLARTDTVSGGVALRGTDGAVDWTFTPEPGAGTDHKVYGAPMRAGTFASSGIPYADGHAVVYTWFARSATGNLVTVVQIRDGRTGELLHEGLGGGPWTLGSWTTGPEGLVMVGTASFRVFGANGVDSRMFTVSQTENGAFATGPDGVRVVVAGTIGGVSTYQPESLTAGRDYPPSVSGLSAIGGREAFVADLDADGVDEVLSLNFDEYGVDRTTELAGGGYAAPFTAMRQMITATLDPA